MSSNYRHFSAAEPCHFHVTFILESDICLSLLAQPLKIGVEGGKAWVRYPFFEKQKLPKLDTLLSAHI
jgi:hypothetical protein